MKKTFLTVFLVLVLSLSTVSISTSAFDDAYGKEMEFAAIDINNQEMRIDSGQEIVPEFERGDRLNVRVALTANEELRDVNVRAEIFAADDDVEDKTDDPINIEQGSTRHNINLGFDLPNDIEEGKYTLDIEATANGVNKISKHYEIVVVPSRRALTIYDVVFNPGQTVKVGTPLYAEVRLKNLGSLDVENIRASFKMPELGLSSRRYTEDLVSEEKDEERRLNDETDSTSILLGPLMIPQTAKGQYTALIEVEGDNDESDSEEFNIVVSQNAFIDQGLELTSLRILPDISQQTLAPGGIGVQYDLTLVNMGKETKTLQFDVIGDRAIGIIRADPSIVRVAPGDIQNVVVYAKANDNVLPGTHSFLVRVTDTLTGNVIQDVVLRANTGTSTSKNPVPGVGKDNIINPDQPTPNGEGTSARTILIIVFVALLVLLIILGLVVALRREPEETIEEPTMQPSEGKKDYY